MKITVACAGLPDTPFFGPNVNYILQLHCIDPHHHASQVCHLRRRATDKF
jgi:hypothetical protein